MRRSRWSVATLAPLLVVASAIACSDKPHRPPASENGSFVGVGGGGGGGGGAIDAATDASSDADAEASTLDAGVCNDVPLDGIVVDRVGVVGDPPPMAGGTIADGSYALTDLSVYVGASGTGGPTGTSVQQSIRVAGGVIASVTRIQTAGDGGAFGPETRVSRSYVVQGTSLVATTTCPAGGGTQQLNFTATNAQLVVVDPQSREQSTYTRR